MSSQIEQVRRFYSVLWNEHDKSAIPSVLHEKVSFRGSLGLEKSDRDGFAEYTDLVHGALDDFRCIIRDIAGTGDTVLAKLTFRGIHMGELMGFRPTGKVVEWTGFARFQFDEDLISDVWVLGDVLGLQEQLESEASHVSLSYSVEQS